MSFHSHHGHLHHPSHHHHDWDDDASGTAAPLDHGAGHTGWAATHGALLGDGGTAIVAGNIDLSGYQLNLADVHGVAGGLLDGGHGVTAVISGNVVNGGVQINIVEVEIGTPGHVLPVH